MYYTFYVKEKGFAFIFVILIGLFVSATAFVLYTKKPVTKAPDQIVNQSSTNSPISLNNKDATESSTEGSVGYQKVVIVPPTASSSADATISAVVDNISHISCALHLSISTGLAPLTVKLMDGLLITNAHETPSAQKLEWDFTGDGTYDKTTSAIIKSREEYGVDYTYDHPGEYHPKLRMTLSNNQAVECTNTVTVK